MKLLGLIFCVLFSTISKAQIQSVTPNRNEVTTMVNAILANTVAKYNQVKIDSLECRDKCLDFWYSDGENFLKIFFYKSKTGGNSDLGIPDTVKYTFTEVRGIYKDIFPSWKKYFQPDANFEEVAKTGNGQVIFLPKQYNRRFRAAFNKSGKEWTIDIREY